MCTLLMTDKNLLMCQCPVDFQFHEQNKEKCKDIDIANIYDIPFAHSSLIRHRSACVAEGAKHVPQSGAAEIFLRFEAIL